MDLKQELNDFISWLNTNRNTDLNEFDIEEYLGNIQDISGKIFYVLCLNHMKSPKIEMTDVICWSESKKDLEWLLESEHVGHYSDSGEHAILHYSDGMAQAAGKVVKEHVNDYTWGKTYRKGGPLEWYNEPLEVFHQGIHEVVGRPTGIPHLSELKEEYGI